MSGDRKTLPSLQKKLGYNGPDEEFKNYVLAALKNRGPLHSQAFKLYYGIDGPKYTVEKIPETLPVYDIYNLVKMVMNRIEEDIRKMMAETK